MLAYRQAKIEFQRQYWREMLLIHNGSVTKTARAAGVGRQALTKMLKQHGIKNAGRRCLRGNWGDLTG